MQRSKGQKGKCYIGREGERPEGKSEGDEDEERPDRKMHEEANKA